MSTYSRAVDAIRATIAQKQEQLDRVASDALSTFRAAFLAALRDNVPEDTPARAVCDLIAQESEISDSGFASLSNEGKAVFRAAVSAGLLPDSMVVGTVGFYADASGVTSYGSAKEEHSAAWQAYRAAKNYRERTANAAL